MQSIRLRRLKHQPTNEVEAKCLDGRLWGKKQWNENRNQQGIMYLCFYALNILLSSKILNYQMVEVEMYQNEIVSHYIYPFTLKVLPILHLQFHIVKLIEILRKNPWTIYEPDIESTFVFKNFYWLIESIWLHQDGDESEIETMYA